SRTHCVDRLKVQNVSWSDRSETSETRWRISAVASITWSEHESDGRPLPSMRTRHDPVPRGVRRGEGLTSHRGATDAVRAHARHHRRPPEVAEPPLADFL